MLPNDWKALQKAIDYLVELGWSIRQDVTCFNVVTEHGEEGQLAWFEVVNFAKKKGMILDDSK